MLDRLPSTSRAFVPPAMMAAVLACALALLPPVAQAAKPSARTPASVPSEPPAADIVQGAQELAMFALGLIGVDYRYGGTTPERGLDCSGLVRYVFQEVTGVTLPRTSKEMARLGGRVASGDLRPGDLVFFNTLRSPFSHVGIYLGENRFIHAPHRGGEVEVAAMTQNYWRQRYEGARRLVGVLPDLLPSAHAEPPAPVDPEPNANPFGASDR